MEKKILDAMLTDNEGVTITIEDKLHNQAFQFTDVPRLHAAAILYELNEVLERRSDDKTV